LNWTQKRKNMKWTNEDTFSRWCEDVTFDIPVLDISIFQSPSQKSPGAPSEHRWIRIENLVYVAWESDRGLNLRRKDNKQQMQEALFEGRDDNCDFFRDCTAADRFSANTSGATCLIERMNWNDSKN
jgi:hypothetical protein